MARNPTRLYRLIEERLDCTLHEFVYERRKPDIRPPAPWQSIADELHQRTGIEISRVGLAKWFADIDPAVPIRSGER